MALSAEQIRLLDAYWRAANYLTVGQIYLRDNPLLREPLTAEHVKPRLLGHWGTSPGLSFIYAHLNRLVRETDADVIYLAGPGHGGPAIVANVYLEGTYSEIYPDVSRDAAGLRRLFRQFSTPGGIPSHVSVPTPGSIHEGGELGYVLVHAFGAAFDNPELIVAAVVGDGEAETGPLAGSWTGIDFLNPARDGAVLPILHLNGYKIGGPTAARPRRRRRHREPAARPRLGAPRRRRATIPPSMHRALRPGARRLPRARSGPSRRRPGARRRPGPRGAPALARDRAPHAQGLDRAQDGGRPAGRGHVPRAPGAAGPRAGGSRAPGAARGLDAQLPAGGALRRRAARSAPSWPRSRPRGDRRLGANPHANGGRLLRPLDLPDFADYALPVPRPATELHGSTRQLGKFMRDIFTRNRAAANFRLFCPDETNSNRLGDVFEVERRCSVLPHDRRPTITWPPDGRVMEILSEHCCQGWLEGYLLTGRHGLFASYEAFAMVSASMTVQHAKWLQEADRLPWRAPVASLNILLTSTSWRKDHNGFSHQGPGLIDVVLSKKGTVSRIYLPPDANCLLSVADHCFRSRNYVNLIVIDKQPQLQWLDLETARAHCARGASVWPWAGSAGDGAPRRGAGRAPATCRRSR